MIGIGRGKNQRPAGGDVDFIGSDVGMTKRLG